MNKILPFVFLLLTACNTVKESISDRMLYISIAESPYLEILVLDFATNNFVYSFNPKGIMDYGKRPSFPLSGKFKKKGNRIDFLFDSGTFLKSGKIIMSGYFITIEGERVLADAYGIKNWKVRKRINTTVPYLLWCNILKIICQKRN